MTAFLRLPRMRPIQYGGRQPYPLFTRISIETSKTCTRSCWFCPSEQRGKKPVTMSDDMYASILDELRALEFDGVVQWFYLNEPLMDRDYLRRIEMLRVACPRVTIHLTTNWDTMHRKPPEEQIYAMGQLFRVGVNSLNLNDYDARGYARVVAKAANAHGADLVDHCWKRLSPRKRVISCGPLPEKLHNWSGYVSDTKNLASQTGRGKCPRPMRHVVVQYDGGVPLCCAVNSAHAEMMGSVTTQSLVEIWNSRKMFEYRERLQRGERSGSCAGCNATVAYPHVFRRVKL